MVQWVGRDIQAYHLSLGRYVKQSQQVEDRQHRTLNHELLDCC